ncbi:MAG: hypothetical protein ACPGOV_07925 [Magnetovibrionaceae bacterium]
MKPWTKRAWIIALVAVLIAFSPLAIALFGQVIGDRELTHYHWLVFFTAPPGLLVGALAGLCALIMTIRDLSGGRSKG